MSYKWTLSHMPELSGKTIIVTGGNSGLGYESVKAFATNGANVILACRSLKKGEAAKAEILKGDVKGKITVMQLDLMDLSSVSAFASKVKTENTHIDVLVNNAGIMVPPYSTTKNGFESQLGTNHLGHFALTAQLWDRISKTPNSRVVNVSSIAHRSGSMNFDNLNYVNGKDYSPIKAYGQSKLANLLFTYELQRKIEKQGLNTMAVAAHPGVSNTNLDQQIKHRALYKFVKPIMDGLSQAQDKGALPQIRAAVDKDVKGGQYYGPDGFMEMKGAPVLVNSKKASHSLEDAKRLWDVSEKLTGVTFL